MRQTKIDALVEFWLVATIFTVYIHKHSNPIAAQMNQTLLSQALAKGRDNTVCCRLGQLAPGHLVGLWVYINTVIDAADALWGFGKLYGHEIRTPT